MKRFFSIGKHFSSRKIHLDSARNENGNVLLIVAFSMVAIFGMGALVLDVGYLYLQQSRMQAAVNAGALAGAQALIRASGSVDVAIQTAEQIAAQNFPQSGGGAAYPVNIVLQSGSAATSSTIPLASLAGTSVHVSSTHTVPLWFARIWGLTHQQLQVAATAQVSALSAATNVVPFVIPQSSFEDDGQDGENHTYTLQTDTKYTFAYDGGDHGGDNQIPFKYLASVASGDSNNGDSQGHSQNGDSSGNGNNNSGGSTNSAQQLLQNIEYGYPSVLKVGDLLNFVDGEKVGPVDKGITYRQTNSTDTSCTSYLTASSSCSQVMILPVVNSFEGEEDQKPAIVGFATFWLVPPTPPTGSGEDGNSSDQSQSSGQGSDGGSGTEDGSKLTFQAYFIQMTYSGTGGSLQGFGTYNAKLIN